MGDSVCVQCGEAFVSGANGAADCCFHLTSSNNRGIYSCCGQREPCQVGKSHTATHHCKYPYAAFFERSRGILGYTDTVEWFYDEELVNFDDNSSQIVRVGHLQRWTSRGDSVANKNILVVAVGQIWYQEKYFFHCFSEQELDAAGASNETVLFRNSPSATQFSQVSWMKENQMVVGLKCELRVASCDVPSVVEVKFTTLPLRLESAKRISRGGIVPRRRPHYLAVSAVQWNVQSVPDLSLVHPRAPRDDFLTLDGISGRRDLHINVVGGTVKCNQNHVRDGQDHFDFRLQVANSGSGGPFMLMKMRVEVKLLNQDHWTSVPQDQMSESFMEQLPMTLAPMSTVAVDGSFYIPHTLADPAAPTVRPDFYVSTVAKRRPLRVRFSFSDAKGRTVSTTVEYVQKLPRLEKPEGDLFLFVDDVKHVNRYCFKLSAGKSKDKPVEGGFELTKDECMKLVHQSNKSGATEIELTSKASDHDEYYVHAWALVDKAAQVVYAIKALLVCKVNGIACMGQLAVPFYGSDDEPPCNDAFVAAVQKVELPQTHAPIGLDTFEYTDKGLDEPTADQLASLTFADPSTSSSVSNLPASLEEQLRLLNQNLARTAAALEKLAELKENK